MALVIMGPLLGPGQILTLDSPLALNFNLAEYFSWSTDGAESVFAATHNSAPFAAVLRGFELLLPFQVVEKMWLVLLLFLCAVGASRLPYLEESGRFYAGFFYLVNPFTYIRFVSGQWGMLGAYALIPFAVTSFFLLLEEPSRKQIAIFVLLLTLISHLQIHGLALALLVVGSLYGANCAIRPESFRRPLPAVRWIVSVGEFFLDRALHDVRWWRDQEHAGWGARIFLGVSSDRCHFPAWGLVQRRLRGHLQLGACMVGVVLAADGSGGLRVNLHVGKPKVTVVGPGNCPSRSHWNGHGGSTGNQICERLVHFALGRDPPLPGFSRHPQIRGAIGAGLRISWGIRATNTGREGKTLCYVAPLALN